MNENSDDQAGKPWRAMIKIGAALIVTSVVGMIIVIATSYLLGSCAS